MKFNPEDPKESIVINYFCKNEKEKYSNWIESTLDSEDWDCGIDRRLIKDKGRSEIEGDPPQQDAQVALTELNDSAVVEYLKKRKNNVSDHLCAYCHTFKVFLLLIFRDNYLSCSIKELFTKILHLQGDQKGHGIDIGSHRSIPSVRNAETITDNPQVESRQDEPYRDEEEQDENEKYEGKQSLSHFSFQI